MTLYKFLGYILISLSTKWGWGNTLLCRVEKIPWLVQHVKAVPDADEYLSLAAVVTVIIVERTTDQVRHTA